MEHQRIVVVTGGRHYHPTTWDAWWLRSRLERLQAHQVVHGGALHRCEAQRCGRRSVDQWGGEIGRRLGLQVREYRPRYDQYEHRRAPLERNLEMLDLGPVAVLALPGRSGTAHTCTNARERLIPVLKRPYLEASTHARERLLDRYGLELADQDWFRLVEQLPQFPHAVTGQTPRGEEEREAQVPIVLGAQTLMVPMVYKYLPDRCTVLMTCLPGGRERPTAVDHGDGPC